MSKHNHSAIAHEVQYIVDRVNSLTDEEVHLEYGIVIFDDGAVHDPVYNKDFVSVAEWAKFNVEQDDEEYEEHFHKG